MRLLVVDDDPPIADLVATVARYEGWEAVTANTGEQALRRAAEFRPGIVVLDLMLPDLDGFGVLDRLRGSGTMVPVVFLTARDGVADRVAGLTRGGDDHLVKPFAVEELMARLRTVLRRSAGPRVQRSVLRVGDLTIAHPAVVRAGLRGPVPVRRRKRAGGTRTASGTAARKGRPDGGSCWTICCCSPGSTRPRRRHRCG